MRRFTPVDGQLAPTRSQSQDSAALVNTPDLHAADRPVAVHPSFGVRDAREQGTGVLVLRAPEHLRRAALHLSDTRLQADRGNSPIMKFSTPGPWRNEFFE